MFVLNYLIYCWCSRKKEDETVTTPKMRLDQQKKTPARDPAGVFSSSRET
jgi:hypothetical protein